MASFRNQTKSSMVSSNNRLVQGMLVAKYKGNGKANGKANALEVFRIPESEHSIFFPWLEHTHPITYCMFKSVGFVSLGSKKTLQTIADDYRKTNSNTRVGWCTVPMQSNSLVLWVGPHRVHHAQNKKDTGCFRTTLYLSLLAQPPCSTLPLSSNEEIFDTHQQGKTVNQSLEEALCEYLASNGNVYGWNQRTIPEEFHNMFAETPHCVQSTGERCSTTTVDILREHGFVVIPNIMPNATADALHASIVQTTRDVMFNIPREGMCDRLKATVAELDGDEFASCLNEPPLK